MNPTVCWPDQTLPVEIYCAPGVLTGLEIVAADGLLAMPRIGLGVGGLLLGRRGVRRIEILKTVEICCSHTAGPAFILTPEEIAAAKGLLESETDPADLVGWYCSKPSFARNPGPMALSENDQALFGTLCPEPWQVALLIRPSMGKTTTAAFGIREFGESGSTFLLGAARELAWQELAAYEVPSRQPEPIREAAVVEALAEIPIAMPRSGTLFGIEEPAQEVRKKRRWPFRLLMATVLLTILAAAAFLTRVYWMPRPLVAMIASADWTGRVSILWNPEALSEQDQATLVIEDGAGPLHTIHLKQAEMQGGWYQYGSRPGRVTVTLLAGDLSDSAAVMVQAPPSDPAQKSADDSK